MTPRIAVLAGGLATRMLPLRREVPKSLMEVAGEPFIAHQLRLFRREGLTEAVLCVGHLGGMIQEFVGDGRAFGLKVTYSNDGQSPLGTGGALLRALPLLGPEFLVIYGDSYLDISFGAVVQAFRSSRAPAMMTVFENRNRWDRSNVAFVDGRIVAYSKKPTPEMAHIDFGLQAVRVECFAGMTAGQTFDLARLYSDLARTGCLAGYEVYRRFYEIGSPRGFEEAEAYLLSQRDGQR